MRMLMRMDLIVRNTLQQCSKLENSAILSNLSSHLSSVPNEKRGDVMALIMAFPALFLMFHLRLAY